jgi:hypothetical protein
MKNSGSHKSWKKMVRCAQCGMEFYVSIGEIYLDKNPRRPEALITFSDCGNCGSSIEVHGLPAHIDTEIRGKI